MTPRDREPMSRQRHCNLQAWAIASNGDGAGAEKMNDPPPSSSSFPLLLLPSRTTTTGNEHAMVMDRDVGQAMCAQFYRLSAYRTSSNLLLFL